jgi:crotonobetainyl-CoA:carnitine CoA-transferase CaiB-like acyl-CoA transferase
MGKGGLPRYFRIEHIILYVGYSVPFGPINNIAQTFSHPQAKPRRIVVEVEVRL